MNQFENTRSSFDTLTSIIKTSSKNEKYIVSIIITVTEFMKHIEEDRLKFIESFGNLSYEEQKELFIRESVRKYQPMGIVLPVAITNSYDEALKVKDQYLTHFDFDCIKITTIKSPIIIQKIPEKSTVTTIDTENFSVLNIEKKISKYSEIEEQIKENALKTSEFNTRINDDIKQEIIDENNENNLEYFKQIIYQLSKSIDSVNFFNNRIGEFTIKGKQFINNFGDHAFESVKELLKKKLSVRGEFLTYETIENNFPHIKSLILNNN